MSQSRCEEVIRGIGVLLKQYSQGIGLKTFLDAYFTRYPSQKFDEAYLRKVIQKTDGLLLRIEVVDDITLIFPLPQESEVPSTPAVEPREIVELCPASVPSANCFFVRRGAARTVARISAELSAHYRKLTTDESTSPDSIATVECEKPTVDEYYAVYDEEMRRYWRVRVNASLDNFIAVTYIDLGNFGEIKWPRLLQLPARWNPHTLGDDNAPAMTLYVLDHDDKPYGFPRSRRGLQLALARVDSPDIFAADSAADEGTPRPPIKAEVLSAHDEFGGHVVRLLAPDGSTDKDGRPRGFFQWTLATTPALIAVDKFYADRGDSEEDRSLDANNNNSANDEAVVNFFAAPTKDDEPVERLRREQWRQWATDNQIKIEGANVSV